MKTALLVSLLLAAAAFGSLWVWFDAVGSFIFETPFGLGFAAFCALPVFPLWLYGLFGEEGR